MLLTDFDLRGLTLPNRVVMAPMTRARAVGDGLPHPAAATYYAQRASAGLIITEGCQISHAARGYVRTPGIHSPDQIDAWRTVTDAVHAAAGRIFLQLWHVGRVSHPDFQDGHLPIAPSALAAEGSAFTAEGMKPLPVPRAIEEHEIPALVEEFRSAAANAQIAGFDGVELHGANGYLLDQFLRDGANQRSDRYGGSVENRLRFPLAVAEAVADVWGADRVGYRISPWFDAHSMSDSAPERTFGCLARRLGQLRLAYLHVVEPAGAEAARRLTPELKRLFAGPVIANGGYDRATAEACFAAGDADLVSFGAAFIANPDLPVRFGRNAPLNTPDLDTFYQGEERGYVDYPALESLEPVQ